MSRVFLPGGCWRDGRDIHSWLATYPTPGTHASPVPTAAGPVELWLADPDNFSAPAGGFMYRYMLELLAPAMEPEASVKPVSRLHGMESALARSTAISALMQSPLASYTMKGAKRSEVPRVLLNNNRVRQSPQSEWRHDVDALPGKLDAHDLLVRCVDFLGKGRFADAVLDAESALTMEPGSALGYSYLAEAYMGLRQIKSGLLALDRGLRIHPGDPRMHEVRGRLQDFRTTLRMVQFPKAVVVVDPEPGRAEFSDLQAAIDYCSQRSPPSRTSLGWTILLRSKGGYELPVGLHWRGRGGVQLQVLGEYCATMKKENISGNEEAAIPPVVEIQSNQVGDCFQIVGSTTVFFDNVALSVGPSRHGETFHCISAYQGARVIARRCSLFSANSPCIGIEGFQTRVEVSDCIFQPASSAGVVISDGSSLFMERSHLSKCNKSAVEIRGIGASARIIDSKFVKCKQQAVSMYNGGELLEMEGCEVKECGCIPCYSAVLIDSGRARLRSCLFLNNAAEAIVVQGQGSSPPQLIVEDCTIKDNQGGVMFGSSGGWGCLSRNTIQGGAGFGINIHAVEGGNVSIENNVLTNNGPHQACDINVNLSSQAKVITKNNNKPARVFPFTLAELHSTARRMYDDA